jgi:hypothetical protein
MGRSLCWWITGMFDPTGPLIVLACVCILMIVSTFRDPPAFP